MEQATATLEQAKAALEPRSHLLPQLCLAFFVVKPKASLFALGKSEEVEWERWTLSFEILEGACLAWRPTGLTAPNVAQLTPLHAPCTEKAQPSAEESAAYNEELSREVAEQLSYISLEIVK